MHVFVAKSVASLMTFHRIVASNAMIHANNPMKFETTRLRIETVHILLAIIEGCQTWTLTNPLFFIFVGLNLSKY